jgi:predicted small secreted protein
MKKILLFALVAITFASCATNGYGCKGTGKLITRVHQ